MKTFAGIDVGYSSTKAISDKVSVNFPSVVGTPDQSRFKISSETSTLVKYRGDLYFIGDSAVSFSRLIQRREDRNWVKSREYQVLICAALAEFPPGEISIVTGLPVAFYDDVEEVKRAFHDGKTLSFGVLVGTPKVHIDYDVAVAAVVPQPFGSLLDLTLDDDGKVADLDLATGHVGIIDVGGKTTNILTSLRLAEVAKDTASVNVGGWDVVRSVKVLLESQYPDLNLRDHEITQAVIDKSIRQYGEDESITKLLLGAIEPLANQVIAQATQLWDSGARLDRVIVTGGGAHLLFPYLAKSFKHAWRHPHPVTGNARGYWKYAKTLGREESE